MFPATITSQGQVTVPALMRRRMNLRPGDKVIFVPDSASREGVVMKKGIPFARLAGVLKPYAKGKPRLTRARLEELRKKMYTERYLRYTKQDEGHR